MIRYDYNIPLLITAVLTYLSNLLYFCFLTFHKDFDLPSTS
nr:MAG TPA: hypothetical protein [Caudoviricetes sp.]